MDLSQLRESLHRLALLERDDVGPNLKGATPVAGLKDGVVGDGDGDASANTTTAAPAENERLGDGFGKGALGLSASSPRKGRPGRRRVDPIGAILGLGYGEGGGIRVFDTEDEWDQSTFVTWANEVGQRRQMGRASSSTSMMLRVLMNGIEALFCVSVGSTVNVLRPDVAKRARLVLTRLEPAAWVELDDGDGEDDGAKSPAMPVEQMAVAAPYQIDGFFARDDFYVAPALAALGQADGIVGADWLKKYRPTINYRLARIELIDRLGRVHVIESVPSSELTKKQQRTLTARLSDWDARVISRGHYMTEINN